MNADLFLFIYLFQEGSRGFKEKVGNLFPDNFVSVQSGLILL